MKNKGFGQLKTRLFTIKTSKNVGLGGPWYILHIYPTYYPLKPWLALAAAPRNLPKHRRSATWLPKPATPRPLQRLGSRIRKGYYCAGWLQRRGCHPGCCFRKKDANLEQKMHRVCFKSAICWFGREDRMSL